MVKRELRDRALSQIDDDEVIRFLQEVISIPGHKDLPHHEKEVAEFFHDWFKKEGIESYLQKVEGERANVIAYIRGSEGDPKLMYNSHLDTKPPYNMSIEPFNPIIREDKVYGRGSCDAKASLTSFTFSLVALKRAGIPLAGDLIFAGVIGEEWGGSPGTRYIIEHGPIADMAIVGEPTKLEVVVAHKTGCNVKIRTVGRSTHTSVPHKGVNAIVKMSKLIEAVEEELPKKLSAKTHKFLGTSTHCACLISGGVHHGVVPDSCELIINLRLIPGETQESIRKYFKEIIEDIEKKDPEFKAEVEVSPVGKYLETNENHQIVHALKDSIRDVMKKEPTVTGAPYWTDGALLSSDGNIPTIVYGPGNIEQAHSSVEFVSIKETLIATRVLTLTALRVCGRANLV